MQFLAGLALAIAGVCASGQPYFPAGSLGRTAEQHRFHAEWYSKHLVALGEDSLWKLAQEQSSRQEYRFLWLRSFHHPVCIRLSVRADGNGLITLKETGGQGGYEPGKLLRNTKKALSKREVGAFLDRVRSVGFWQTLANEDSGVVGLDGAQWVIEAVKEGRYHVVHYWSPPETNSIRVLGWMLMSQLAGFQAPAEEVY